MKKIILASTIMLGAGLVLLLAALVLAVFRGSGGQEVACPMDAKLCADGSAVGRSGPNCEYARCPTGEEGY